MKKFDFTRTADTEEYDKEVKKFINYIKDNVGQKITAVTINNNEGGDMI